MFSLKLFSLLFSLNAKGEVIDPNVDCGGGVKIKTRSCTNPKPQGNDPKECPGESPLFHKKLLS